MFDYALAQAMGDLCEKFHVKPGFCYYKESGEDFNALATDRVVTKLSGGTVLFGFNMLSYLFQNSDIPAAAVLAVIAHEFGHIVAITRGLNDQLAPDKTNPFRAEQFADFMSGFYAGQRLVEDEKFHAVVFATTMQKLGGDDRGSHGTHKERGSAVLEGFKTGKQKAGLDDAVNAGFKFAMAR